MSLTDVSLTKEELFRHIRHDAREGLSIRALARRHGVHRRLARQALRSPTPKPRKTPTRRAPRLDPLKKTIDEWLRNDLQAPPKQRHTIKRIATRLEQEHNVRVPYTTLRDYVTPRRPQIAAEAGEPLDAFVIRHNRPGADAEVDFGDVTVNLDGTLTRCYLFAFRLCYSGRAVHRVSLSCGQEAFLEGHVHALHTIGGVPTGQVRYDNLTPAVHKVLFRTRDRQEQPRWSAFHDHYDFTPFYTQPGLEGAHEKGGVEGQVGYFRRNYLTPVPNVATIDELNTQLAEHDRRELDRHISQRERSIGEDLAIEAPLLAPLPPDDFPTSRSFTCLVDRFGMIHVRRASYSVPARFIGRTVRAVVSATEVAAYDGRTEVARHPRSNKKGKQRIVLDHFLEVLLRKPGALAGSEALDQARREGTFTTAHDALWAAATAAHGDAEGTKALVRVLLLHRHMDHRDVTAGIRAALSVGACTPDVVAVQARKAAQAAGRAPTVTAQPPPGPDLDPPPQPAPPAGGADPHRRLAELPGYHRPPPDLTAWDQLLRHPRGAPP